MKKQQPRKTTRYIWAKPWRILRYGLCRFGTPSGCSHPVQGSTEKTGAVLRMSHTRGPARGPLRICAANSRYFADDMGNIVYLTGSHTWNNFQDCGSSNPPPGFDYEKYLDFLVRHDHNFFRLFVWEQSSWVPWSSEKVWFTPLPYQRTGPGTALDGELRFNLREWNQQYFKRLRARVRKAGDLGIYVSVMLFNGWSVDGGKRSAMTPEWQKDSLGDPWRGHPFNPDNNINGIDGGGWGKVHTLQTSTVTELQKAYVRKVIDTVGDLDNVLWEISNESNPESTLWEYEMIRFIHRYEATRPKQHPVGMTAEYPGGSNADLWQSPADWISPGSPAEGAYAKDPPAATGGKVIITDTDHIWGIGGSQDWVWKSFTRGLNPIFMDPYDTELVELLFPTYLTQLSTDSTRAAREWACEVIRNNLGYTRAYDARMNLASMMPHGELASSGYCLANPGLAYLVYLPAKRGRRFLRKLPSDWFSETVEVDLSQATGDVKFEWFEPDMGTTVADGIIEGRGKHTFAAPVRGGGLVLYIHAG